MTTGFGQLDYGIGVFKAGLRPQAFGGATTGPSCAAILTRSGIEYAFILRITCPRSITGR